MLFCWMAYVTHHRKQQNFRREMMRGKFDDDTLNTFHCRNKISLQFMIHDSRKKIAQIPSRNHATSNGMIRIEFAILIQFRRLKMRGNRQRIASQLIYNGLLSGSEIIFLQLQLFSLTLLFSLAHSKVEHRFVSNALNGKYRWSSWVAIEREKRNNWKWTDLSLD